MRGHPPELRTRLLAEYQAGEGAAVLSERHHVSLPTIRKWALAAGLTPHPLAGRAKRNRKRRLPETRVCVVCGAFVTRARFINQPHRTTCSRRCAGKLVGSQSPTSPLPINSIETILGQHHVSFSTAQRLLAVDRSTLAEALREGRIAGAFRWEGHWIIPRVGIGEYDRRRRERFPHRFAAGGEEP